MEDMLVSLFDPLLNDIERVKLHRIHPTVTVQPLDEAEGVGAPHGIKVVFKDSTSFSLIIISSATSS